MTVKKIANNIWEIEKEGKMMLEKEEDTFKDVYKFSAKALAEIWARPEEDIWHEYLKNER